MERNIILLTCSQCKSRNYSTTRTKKTGQEKLKIKKYCEKCHQHTEHKETKA
ncbi:MAG: 50S ribosomal protein L33 [Deltaproteobacteria bacterium]|nr:50S ribosomal protein L33 [Deltaproteobacteria bacterium]